MKTSFLIFVGFYYNEKDVINTNYTTMHFLFAWCGCPSAWQLLARWYLIACQMFWAAWQVTTKHLPSNHYANIKQLTSAWYLLYTCFLDACQAA